MPTRVNGANGTTFASVGQNDLRSTFNFDITMNIEQLVLSNAIDRWFAEVNNLKLVESMSNFT